MLESKGEQTDKIIMYSPINDTHEEILEAAVNLSNNLNVEESLLVINQSSSLIEEA